MPDRRRSAAQGERLTLTSGRFLLETHQTSNSGQLRDNAGVDRSGSLVAGRVRILKAIARQHAHHLCSSRHLLSPFQQSCHRGALAGSQKIPSSDARRR